MKSNKIQVTSTMRRSNYQSRNMRDFWRFYYKIDIRYNESVKQG